MKINLDTPVMDLATGKQAMFNGVGATLRAIIIHCGCMPSRKAQQAGAEPPEETAAAYTLATKAAAAPAGGMLELSVKEASLLKTRAYDMCFPVFAGALDHAIESAAPETTAD